MRHLCFCFILLISTLRVSAQNNYSASLIPKGLLSYASAVIRNEETTIEVVSTGDVEYHVKTVTTVLNKNGDEKVTTNLRYDKMTSVRYIKGFIYDEFGKISQKINERDFDDYALTDGFSLYQDNRFKHFTKTADHYPYTIEIEYVLKMHQSLYFRDWEPNLQSNVAIEKSSFKFICDPAFSLRYKEFNVPGKVEMSTNKAGKKIYTWQIANINAWRDEPLTPPENKNEIKVLLAPERFAYEKYSGSFASWQQLGKWEYDNLLKNRTVLPEATVQYIKSVTADIKDPKQKAKMVYEYMQQKTHYISIQVGIGGLQPFTAEEVDKVGYGDCKALVNYTHALLQAIGIDSYYCEVYADHDDQISLISDFPSIQGNHIILCLPFKNDTTWLECTSQNYPFGYLGDFTDDRTVLACTPDGGKLLHTPKYAADKNTVTRKANFTLSESGDLAGQMQTTFKGLEYDDRDPTIEKAKTEWSKDFKKYYGINNVFIKKLDYKQEKTIDPVTSEQVELSARDYGAITDGKYYFSLNSVDHTASSIKHIRNRANPVTITHGRTFVDEITYNLPKGYQLDSEPLNVSIDKTFGNFTATMSIKGDQLIYTRKFQIKDGTYDKDVYQDIADFYDAVIDADNYNVTLVKK